MSANGSNMKLNFFPEILDYMKKFVNYMTLTLIQKLFHLQKLLKAILFTENYCSNFAFCKNQVL